MDAAETLFKAVRVPGQVVVYHEVGALEVDTLPGGVCRDEDLHVGVMLERLLDLQSLFAPYATVDHNHRFRATDDGLDSLLEVVQGVLVLGKDNQLLLVGWYRLPILALTVWGFSFVGSLRESCGSEDLGEQVGEFLPLAVLAAATDRLSEAFEPLERADFGS